MVRISFIIILWIRSNRAIIETDTAYRIRGVQETDA